MWQAVARLTRLVRYPVNSEVTVWWRLLGRLGQSFLEVQLLKRLYASLGHATLRVFEWGMGRQPRHRPELLAIAEHAQAKELRGEGRQAVCGNAAHGAELTRDSRRAAGVRRDPVVTGRRHGHHLRLDDGRPLQDLIGCRLPPIRTGLLQRA